MTRRVLGLARSIQYCVVIDKLDYVVASEHRQSSSALMTEEDGQRQALQTAIRHFKRQSWEQNLGKVYYSSKRYEKTIGVTIPVGVGHLMLVGFSPKTRHFDTIIMDRVIPLVEENPASINSS